MNAINVATALDNYIYDNDRTLRLPTEGGPSSLDHLSHMLDKIKDKKVTGDKAQRWIGYVQGILVGGGADLEDMKAINKNESWPVLGI